jgi:hypothetical protein
MTESDWKDVDDVMEAHMPAVLSLATVAASAVLL